MVLCLALWGLAGCRTSQPDPAPAGEEVAAEKVVAAAPLAEWGQRLSDPALADTARLAAARKLQAAAPETLAAQWGRRDNPRIIRPLIEEQLAANDEGVLPLLLALFERVEGEERIDFEHDILHFGRKGEGRMLALLHAADRSLVMRAMDALAKMGSPVAGDSIARLLRHPEPWLRISAAHAVGEIGAEGAEGHLVAALDDTVYSLVNAALVGLGRLKAVESYGRIAELVTSDNKHVRKHAAIALGELGDPRGLAVVRILAKNDPDSGVRFMAGKARDKIGAGAVKWLWLSIGLAFVVAGCESGKKILDQIEEEPVVVEETPVEGETPDTAEPGSGAEEGAEDGSSAEQPAGEEPVSSPGIGPADPPYATEVTFPSGMQLDGLGTVPALTATYPDPGGGLLPFAAERQRHYAPVEYFIDIQTLSADLRDQRVATNFKLNEYVWIPERNQDRHIYIDAEIALHAQELRDAWGGPLVLTSTYRSPEYNASINGAFFSRHMYGDAVDVKANNETMAFDLYNLAKFLEVNYLDAPENTIVGRNTPWLHLDDRGWPLNNPDTR